MIDGLTARAGLVTSFTPPASPSKSPSLSAVGFGAGGLILAADKGAEELLLLILDIIINSLL
jgi:hypothetical protein